MFFRHTRNIAFIHHLFLILTLKTYDTEYSRINFDAVHILGLKIHMVCDKEMCSYSHTEDTCIIHFVSERYKKNSNWKTLTLKIYLNRSYIFFWIFYPFVNNINNGKTTANMIEFCLFLKFLVAQNCIKKDLQIYSF